MPVKIRLQRHGKKGKPFFHIVAADVRTKRDGRYIEKFGSYNPNTNPATIEIDNERALYWLQNGAQPTDTAKAILSYRGVIYRNHLLKGVAKGAFDMAEADKRYENWLSEKEAKIQAKRDKLSAAEEAELAETLKRERAIKEARAADIAAANSPLVEEAPAEGAEAEASDAAAEATDAVEETAEATAEVVEEAAEKVEEAVEETAEEVVEVAEEAAEKVEEVVEDAKEAVAEAAEEVADAATSDDAKEEKKDDASSEEEKSA